MAGIKSRDTITQELPPIPDKRFFPIRQAAELCGVQPHVLRYWEEEFPKLKPNKRQNGRRYYKQQHIELIRNIRELLYGKGYTIAGARQQLKNINTNEVKVQPEAVEIATEEIEAIEVIEPTVTPKSPAIRPILSQVIAELESLVNI